MRTDRELSRYKVEASSKLEAKMKHRSVTDY